MTSALRDPDPLLSRLTPLAEASEAVARAHPGLPEGHDAIPAAARSAWHRVLLGLAKGEGIEEWVVGPMTRGIEAHGVEDGSVARFLNAQQLDEARHEALVRAYVARHWDEPHLPVLASHRLLYDVVFKAIIRQSERHPLRLLLPLWIYERTVSHYLTRLIDCAGEPMPVLSAAMKEIRLDEARHVAGIGMLARALVAHRPPGVLERWVIGLMCWLVAWDMDRAVWWKRGLKRHMATLGLDAMAMRADNLAVLAEARAILTGRGA